MQRYALIIWATIRNRGDAYCTFMLSNVFNCPQLMVANSVLLDKSNDVTLLPVKFRTVSFLLLLKSMDVIGLS